MQTSITLSAGLTAKAIARTNYDVLQHELNNLLLAAVERRRKRGKETFSKKKEKFSCEKLKPVKTFAIISSRDFI